MTSRYPLLRRSDRDDERFSQSFIDDLMRVFRKHGYPPLGTRDVPRLQLLVWRFLYTTRRKDGTLVPAWEPEFPNVHPDSHAEELAGYPGVDYSVECRAARYPVRSHLPLSMTLVGSVGRALGDGGWPIPRHHADYERVARALRWIASGWR